MDIVEKLSVILAPSGRPISALVNGNIVFTAKISGVPDLLLSLSSPGGPTGIKTAMDLPCFHPCVRLAKWRDRPGDLSFVPPDGKFVLASYETDLLPSLLDSANETTRAPKLDVPVSIETRTAQGTYGDEFEVRLFVKQSAKATSGSSASGSLSRNLSGPGRFGPGSSGLSGDPKPTTAPTVEDIRVKVAVPSAVRNVDEIKTSTGEAHYLASESTLEWRVSSKEATMIGSNGASMRCTIIGHTDASYDADAQTNGHGLITNTFDYDEDAASMKNGDSATSASSNLTPNNAKNTRRHQDSGSLMPRSTTLSFAMRGWLASGIKVDSLTINTKTSKGLGSGVTPYKGVKYHTVSRDGIEVRC